MHRDLTENFPADTSSGGQRPRSAGLPLDFSDPSCDNRGTMSNLLTVYVALLAEGTAVWRPVPAESVRPAICCLLGTVPDEERWQFQPG